MGYTNEGCPSYPDPVHAQGEWVELNIEGRKYTVWAIRPVGEESTAGWSRLNGLIGSRMNELSAFDTFSSRAITAWLDAMPKPINPPRTEAQHK